MKLTFFVLKFPILSETFVINQVKEFVRLGEDVKVVSVYEPVDRVNLGEMLGLDVSIHYLIKENCNDKYSIVRGILGGFFKIKFISKFSLYFSVFQHNRFADFMRFLYINGVHEDITTDVVLCHFGPNGILANNLKKAGLLKGKIATVFHGFDLTVRTILDKYGSDYALLFKETELMLPISELWKKKLIELGCSPNKCMINHMGIDLHDFEFCPNKREVNQPLRVLLTGRATEKKGIEYAVSAISLCDFPVELRIIGNGPLYGKLQGLVDVLNLQEKVSLLGAQANSIVKEHLRWADVFLLPSVTAADGDMEGIPVSLMEAMAAGVLVVSTYHSGIPELVEHNHNGLLTRERDASGIANTLREIVDGKVNIRYLLDNARKTIENEFNNEKNYEQLHAYLTGLIDE